MGSLSNYAEDALLNHLVNASQSAPSNLYLALCTADPTDAGTGASMNETANSNSYARTAITFGAAASRRVTQNADITFPPATGTYGAAITHWAVVDSATHGAGNMWAHGQFSASFTPVTGNAPKVVTALQEVYVQINASSSVGLTDYAVHNLLDCFFRNQAFTSPAGNTFVFLSTTVLDDQDVTASDFTEATGTDYAREEVNPDGGASPSWNTVSGGETTNDAAVDFGTVGSGGWGTVVAAGIIDSASGAGNVLAFDSTIPDQTLNANDTVSYATDALHLAIT